VVVHLTTLLPVERKKVPGKENGRLSFREAAAWSSDDSLKFEV